MMVVTISGAVILIGSVDWENGATIGGNPVALESDKFQGMAPVPIPPPPTGDPCPCVPPIPDNVENVMTPGSHHVGGDKFIAMGAMYLQKSGGKTCQPMIAMSAQTVINNTPVVTTVDAMMFMGILNGAGAS